MMPSQNFFFVFAFWFQHWAKSYCFQTTKRGTNTFILRISEPIDSSFGKSPEKKESKKFFLRDAEGVPSERIRVKPRSTQGSTVSGGSGIRKIMNQGSNRRVDLQNPNNLRIIGGSAKGKKLLSPDVYLRPMMSKVREALFSTLGFMGMFDTNTTHVLDMFAGSGSVGLEALSRGAAGVTFVDLSPNCVQTALNNAELCGFKYQATAVCCRAEEALRDPARFGLTKPFQLISITPPYEEVVYKELIDAVCESPLVEENTIVVIEYPVEMGCLPPILGMNSPYLYSNKVSTQYNTFLNIILIIIAPQNAVLGGDKLFGCRNRKHGRTVLGMYVYRPNNQFDMRPDEFIRFK